jgi:Ca2+-binding RTX toxin-like protein
VSLFRGALLFALLGVLGVLASAPTAVAAPMLGELCLGEPATVVGTDGRETINGTGNREVIIAGDGNDTINGNGGEDVICAGDSDTQRENDQFDDDIVRGGEDRDRINGGFGNDLIDGRGGNDELLGDDGTEPSGFVSTADKIDGGDGDDLLRGGGDQDILRGQNGADQIEAQDGNRAFIDVVIGGSDRDECNADEEDDVSECEDGENLRNLSSDDDLSPNNFFGSSVSAQRPSSSQGGSSPDPGPDRNFFFSTSRGLYPFCLPDPPLVGKRGISAFRLGERTVRSVLRPLVLPLSARRGRYVYCNEGGGQTYLLSARGKVRLLATNAETRRTRGIAPGDRLSSLRRKYKDAERIGPGLYRGGSASPVFFGIGGGRVSFVGVSPRGLLTNPADLARAIRLLRPGQP